MDLENSEKGQMAIDTGISSIQELTTVFETTVTTAWSLIYTLFNVQSQTGN